MALPNELSVNLGLPLTPDTRNPEIANALSPVHNALRALAMALDSYTGVLSESPAYYSELGIDKLFHGLNSKFYLVAGEDLTYGELLGIDPGGSVYKADDGILQCIGFCSAADGALTGDYVEIQTTGLYPAFPAATLTPGNVYYCSSTAGTIGAKAAAPTWEQVIGFAISDTRLFFNPQYVKL